VAFAPLVRAAFVERPNRFLVVADLDGVRVRAASRDPGRLGELLVPGAELRLARSPGKHRKTAFTLTLVRHEGTWVSLIPDLANGILAAALARRGVRGLRASVLRREVSVGRSRFDFLLEVSARPVLAEVKSATLVVGGRALFPDAPTSRGVRHLLELTAHRRKGGESLVVFLVQRSDCRVLSPNARRDPAFAEALKGAVRSGVRVLCYRCAVEPRGCTLLGPIPLDLGGGGEVG
jgi:sugar fermentation stimulation protein A